jgi:heterotetrameric sarcosine oxidase delta subunit
MILLPCPWCGPRPATEFAHVGEVSVRPDPAAATPAQWRGYLYLRANPCGWTSETWYHRMGCRRFIKVERHTETNEIRSASAADAEPPDGRAVALAAGAEAPGGMAGARAGGAAAPGGTAGAQAGQAAAAGGTAGAQACQAAAAGGMAGAGAGRPDR